MAEHHVKHGTVFSLSRTLVSAGEKIRVENQKNLVGCYVVSGEDRRYWDNGDIWEGEAGQYIDGLADGGFEYEAVSDVELLCVLAKDNRGAAWRASVMRLGPNEGRVVDPTAYVITLTDGIYFNGVEVGKESIAHLRNATCSIVAPSGGGAILTVRERNAP